MKSYVEHTLDPIFDGQSKVLILGTMPSPKSRQNQFYYAHPQNRFWRVLSEAFDEPLPTDNDSRKAFLLRHHIALWDVLHSCVIDGADDASIAEPVPNDIASLVQKTNIQYIFTTGKKAYNLYNRFCRESVGLTAHPLPSTSPANQRYWKYDDILREYGVLLAYV